MTKKEIAKQIVDDKNVDIKWLLKSENYSKYNLGVGYYQRLKRKEYTLLKEVFSDDIS